MPRQLDEMHLHNALRNEAIPDLEQLARNPGLRDRAISRRFDREPPPYESSTEEEEEHLPASFGEKLAIIEAPLAANDRDSIATNLQHDGAYKPGQRYEADLDLEKQRLKSFAWNYHAPSTHKTKTSLRGRSGDERINIIARHVVKRRWQRLGVWNPEWGIPGRVNQPQPNDNPLHWKWRWQTGRHAAEWTDDPNGALARNPEHPITRAVLLRQGIKRDEYIPTPPLSHLDDEGESASRAEAFIISRPWFIWQVQMAEENERFMRLFFRFGGDARDGPVAGRKHVMQQWEVHGVAKETWTERAREKFVPGWKWRHESPSPEPEGLVLLNTDEMEFTPSEVDALEAIPAPTSPPPFARRYVGDPPAYEDPADMPRLGLGHEQPALEPPQVPIQMPGPRPGRGRRQYGSSAPRRSARIAAKRAANTIVDPPADVPGRERLGTIASSRAGPSPKSHKQGRPSRVAAVARNPPADNPPQGHARQTNASLAALPPPQPPSRPRKTPASRALPARPPAAADEPNKRRPKKANLAGVTKAKAERKSQARSLGKLSRGTRME